MDPSKRRREECNIWNDLEDLVPSDDYTFKNDLQLFDYDDVKPMDIEKDCLDLETSLREAAFKCLDFSFPDYLSVDLKQLATCLGDAYIGQSELRGGFAEKTLKELLLFDKFIPKELYGQLKVMHSDIKNLSEKTLLEICEKYANDVKCKGQHAFVSGFKGSKMGDSGHVVVFEAILSRDGKTGALKIYQKGFGINEFHAKQIRDVKERYSIFYEKKGIPAWILKNPTLYLALMGPYVFQRGDGKEWDEHAVYDFVRLVLPGTETNSKRFTVPQRSGTCFQKSILCFMKDKMDEKTYDRFSVTRKLATLMRFEADFNPKKHADPASVARFTGELALKLCGTIDDMHATGVLNLSEKESFKSYLLNISVRMNDGVWQKELVPIDFKRLKCALPLLKDVIEELNTGFKGFNGYYDGIGTEFLSKLIFDRPKNAKDIHTHLKNLTKSICESNKNERYIDGVLKASLSLSQLPSLLDASWDKYSHDDVVNLIEQLYQLTCSLINFPKYAPTVLNEHRRIYEVSMCWLTGLSIRLGHLAWGAYFGPEKPLLHTNLIIGGKETNRLMIPGCVHPIFDDLVAIRTNNPNWLSPNRKTRVALTISHKIFNFGELQLCDPRGLLLKKMLQFLRKDIRNKTILNARIESWGSGKYLSDFTRKNENEPNLHQFKKIVLLATLLNLGRNSNFANVTFKHYKPESDKECFLDLTFPKKIDPPKYPLEFKGIDATDYSLIHTDSQGKVETGFRRACYSSLIAADWLREIKENEHVLVDSCSQMISSLSNVIVNDGIRDTTIRLGVDPDRIEEGSTPLKMMLLSDEGERWANELALTLNKSLKQKDLLWKARASGALELATVVNLSLFRLQQQEEKALDIQPIHITEVSLDELKCVDSESQWTASALLAVCQPLDETCNHKEAWDKLSREHVAGDLREALLRRIFNDFPERVDQLGPGVDFHEGADGLTLPHWLRKNKDYQVVTAHLKKPNFKRQKDGSWLSEDLTVSLKGTGSWSLRGDALLNHFKELGSSWYFDKEAIEPYTYYTLSHHNNNKNTRLKCMLFRISHAFVDPKNRIWISDHLKQLFIEVETEKKVFLWSQINDTSRCFFQDPEYKFIVSQQQTTHEVLGICLPKALNPKNYRITRSRDSSKLMVDILNFGLKFEKLKSDAKLYSLNYPDYWVDEGESVLESTGMPYVTLRNNNGNIKLVFFDSRRSSKLDRELSFGWDVALNERDSFYVLERKALKETSIDRENLFDGPTAGILYLIRGLLQNRSYELARKYVDMLGRRNWKMQNIGYYAAQTIYNPMKIEHPKAVVLRLRLLLQCSGEDSNYLKTRYYAMYHQLPEDWVLSKREEEKLNNQYFNPHLYKIDQKGVVEHQVLFQASSSYCSRHQLPKIKRTFESTEPCIKDLFVGDEQKNIAAYSMLGIFHAAFLKETNNESLLINALCYTMSSINQSDAKLSVKPQLYVKSILAGELQPEINVEQVNLLAKPMDIDQSMEERIMGVIRGYAKLSKEIEYKKVSDWFNQTNFTQKINRELVQITLTDRQQLQKVSKGYRIGSHLSGVSNVVAHRLSLVEFLPRKRLKTNFEISDTSVIKPARTLQKELFTFKDQFPSKSITQKIFSILTKVKACCKLPVSENKLKKLQESLKNMKNAPAITWKITDEIQISSSLDIYQNLADTELKRLDSKITALLNHEECVDRSLLGSREEKVILGVSHAFQWLATLKELPKEPAALQLLDLLESYAYTSAWIRRLDDCTQLLKNKDFDRLKEQLTDVYQPNGVAHLSTYKFAAFAWQYQTLFRKQQAEYLPKIIEMDRGYLAKLETGAGKTAVYTPACIDAFEESLVVNLVPDGLVEQQEHLQNIFSKMSEVKTDTLNYARTITNVPPLISEGEERTVCLLTTGGDMLRLLLNTLESYVTQLDRSTFKSPRIKRSTFERHLKRFSEDTVAIYDEPQLLFEGNKEQAYALKTCIGLPQERIEVATSLYKILLDEKILVKGGKNIVKWTPEISQKIATALSKAPVMRLYNKNDQKFAVKYMLQPAILSDEEEKEFLKLRNALGLDAARALGIARAQIQVYLPFTLSQRYGVKYGPSKGYFEARPYVALDTPAPGNSTHSIIETLLNYTLQMYLIQGLNFEQTVSLLGSWREIGALGSKCFSRCLKGTLKENITLESLPYLSRQKQNEIIAILGQSEKAVIDYVQLVAAKKIAYSTSKIRVAGSALSAILRKGVAWSATPYNLEGFPLALQEGFVHSESDLKTIQRLCHAKHTLFKVTQSFDCKEFALNEGVYAVIDPHAALYRQKNIEVAKEILKGAREQIKRVAFFSDDCWKQIDRTGKVNLLGKLGRSDESVFFYYDMSRSTGTHFDLPKNAEGVVLVPKGTPYFSLAQGCGRLREWGKGQKIHLHVHKDVNIESAEELIAKTFNNEGENLQSVIVSMHRDQMDAIFLRKLIDKLLILPNTASGEKSRGRLIQKLRNFIVTDVDLDTFEEVGLTKLATDKEIITEYYQKIGSIKNFWNKNDRIELNKIYNNCIKLLPEGSTSHRLGNIAMTAETDQEVQVTKEISLEFQNIYQYSWSPKKVFTSKEFEPTVVNVTSTIAASLYGLFITKVNAIFKDSGFPDALLVTPMAFNRETRKNTEQIIGLDDLSEVASQLYYESLPKVQHVLRLRFNSSKESQYILLHPEGAHLVARHLSSKPKLDFQATLLTVDCQRIAGVDDNSSKADKVTCLMLALVKLINGQCRSKEAIAEIINFVSHDFLRRSSLYTYLLKRNRHLPIEHPDSSSQSEIANVLRLKSMDELSN